MSIDSQWGIKIDIQLSDSVFFPGETVYCKLDVANKPGGKGGDSASSPVSWTAMQLHGICSVDPNRVSIKEAMKICSYFNKSERVQIVPISVMCFITMLFTSIQGTY